MRKFFVIFLAIIFTGFIFVSTMGSSLPLEIKTKPVPLPKIGKGATKFCVMATAYGPPEFPEGQATYSGDPVRFGIVAVNLNDPRIPFGSRLRIEGFGGVVFEALDTGVPVGYIDIWLPSAKEAEAFELRTLEIETLRGGP